MSGKLQGESFRSVQGIDPEWHWSKYCFINWDSIAALMSAQVFSWVCNQVRNKERKIVQWREGQVDNTEVMKTEMTGKLEVENARW